ncbi:hypothetical protein KSP39_PZI007369 [Platanthera zijinensis]|uniref:Uncharacterized protein n=1 Tax=Platanthera zijinensis TaxID=2320716 RepID=A0AAP0BQ48_9ASPA
MKKTTIIDDSPLHASSARKYPFDWRTNPSTLHPRSTATRIRSLARSFTQQDCEASNKHQTKESETPLFLHLDRGLTNKNPHAYTETAVERVSIETEAYHVPGNPTNLELDADNDLYVTKKRTRGPTVGHEWTKRRQNNLERVDVQLPVELQRLVGYRAQELITKCGRYVRLHAPLNVEKWSEISTDIIDKLINIIYAEFNLPNESHVRGDLISSLRRHYNIWRFHLYNDYYLEWSTDLQRRANCPKDIDPAHWNWIIRYWGSTRFKRSNGINKQNKSQQKMKSHVESKSIARTIYEMRGAPQEQDELPLYVRLWEKTHKGKHNEWQDEATEEIYKKLLELHDTQIKEKGEDKLTLEEAYTTILGHHSGYILGMGSGPRPSEHARTNVQQLQAEIRAELEVGMSSRIQEMEDRMTQRMSHIQEMEDRMTQRMSHIQEMEDRMTQIVESKILALLKQRQPGDEVESTN